jgi:cyanate permease
VNAPRLPQARPTLKGRHVAWSGTVGLVLLLLLIAIAWRATNALWFLLFPALLIGVVAAAAIAVLWGLRHF